MIRLLLVYFLIVTKVHSQIITEIKTTGIQCLEMKKECKEGKLTSNERIALADTTAVTISGQISDITEKLLPFTQFKFSGSDQQHQYLYMTDSLGNFRLVMHPGTYSFRMQPFGYKELNVKGLVFVPGEIRILKFSAGEYCCTKTKSIKTDQSGSKK